MDDGGGWIMILAVTATVVMLLTGLQPKKRVPPPTLFRANGTKHRLAEQARQILDLKKQNATLIVEVADLTEECANWERIAAHWRERCQR